MAIKRGIQQDLIAKRLKEDFKVDDPVRVLNPHTGLWDIVGRIETNIPSEDGVVRSHVIRLPNGACINRNNQMIRFRHVNKYKEGDT